MATMKVYRYDPDRGGEPRFEEFDVDAGPGRTVLDLLDAVHYRQDPTLSYRRSCRSQICGSCGMNMNGRTGLACNTQAMPLFERDGFLLVEPMKNMPVLKDLVVDMGPFWKDVTDVRPYLRPGPAVPKGPYVVPKAKMETLRIAQDCIMCGSCLSECTSREANPDYLGPAALAKAYRFVEDARDDATVERLRQYSEPHGIWDCDTCLYCNDVCPMHVKPMDAIMILRERAIQAGIESQGAKHAIAFFETVMRTGKLNEFQTANQSLGIGGLARQGDVAVRVALKGKQPEIRKKPIRGISDVQTLARLTKERKRRGK